MKLDVTALLAGILITIMGAACLVITYYPHLAEVFKIAMPIALVSVGVLGIVISLITQQPRSKGNQP